MNKFLAIICVFISTTVMAAPLGDYSFKSPSFNGNGYSAHVLTIENQEYTRQKAINDALKAAADAAAATAANSNINKFMSNLESRIYAQISQNVATAMFANNGCTTGQPCQGSINFQGNTISWQKTTDPNTFNDAIALTVTGPTLSAPTTIYVPLSSFVIPGQ